MKVKTCRNTKLGPCVVLHTLQLAITDVLKNKKTTENITETREVCKKLRLPVVRSVLRAVNKKKPILDCPTRWNSAVDMLQRLLDLKECCEDKNKGHYLCPETWKELENIFYRAY